MKKNRTKILVVVLCLFAVLLAMLPLLVVKDASFGGTDDAGGDIIADIDEGYEPWAQPPLERLLSGELPGEVESTLFCVQTGIGVGVIAFVMGRYVERKKWMDETGRRKKEKADGRD